MKTVFCDIDGSELNEITNVDYIQKYRDDITLLIQESFEQVLQALQKKEEVVLELRLIQLQLEFVAHVWREIVERDKVMIEDNKKGRKVFPITISLKMKDLSDPEGGTFFLRKRDENKLTNIKFITEKGLFALPVSSVSAENKVVDISHRATPGN